MRGLPALMSTPRYIAWLRKAFEAERRLEASAATAGGGGGGGGMQGAGEEGEEASAGGGDPSDYAYVMPPQPGYFSYRGSLTSPPCSEGVLWAVMAQPVRMSGAQLQAFAG